MGSPPVSGLRLPSREALLASLPPGLGHLRARRWTQGLLTLGGFLFVAYVVLNPADYARPPPPWGLVLAGLAVFLGFWLYAARDLERLEGPGTERGRATGRPFSRRDGAPRRR